MTSRKPCPGFAESWAVGLGRQTTRPCDKTHATVRLDDGKSSQPAKNTKSKLRQDTALLRLLRTAVEQTSGDDGWAHMGQVASYISNNNSSFSSINYGYKKISDLIKATDLFKIEMRNGTAMYIRDPKS